MKVKINTIYNMDCYKGLKLIPNKSIDKVLTSPPYNIIRPNSTDRGYDLYKDGMTNEQYSDWIISLFEEFDRVLVDNGCIMWNMSYGCENTECMSLTIADIIRKSNFTIADIIVWKKQSATPNNVSKNKLTRICEFVYIFCRKSEFQTFEANKVVVNVRETGQDIYENVFNFIEAPNNDESTDLNKATFSSRFVQKLLNIYAKENDIILDTFMGTGTTAIGCINMSMNFIGFELSEAQCRYSATRIKNRISQCGLFDTIDYNEEKHLKTRATNEDNK